MKTIWALYSVAVGAIVLVFAGGPDWALITVAILAFVGAMASLAHLAVRNA